MGLINLGNISLEGFEVPSSVEFGGKHRVIVHRLIGGARVIDAMGRDDAVLQWRGVLSGAEAADRARSLDAIRAAGSLQLLTWDAFCYSVVLSDLRLSFRSPWWIPYEAVCTVQQDLAFNPPSYSPDIVTSIVSDLSEVSQLLVPAIDLGISSMPYLLTSGQAGQAAVSASTRQVQVTLTQGIAGAETGMSSGDLGSLVSSSGTLAQLCCAQGYLDRSVSNIASLGT